MLKTLVNAIAGAMLLVAAPLAVEAAPVLYNVEFDAIVGDSGTGSFRYDAGAGTMTDFTWDFGSGRTGGLLDSILASPSPFGTSLGQEVFEIMTSSTESTGRGLGFFTQTFTGSFPGESFALCWGDNNGFCGLPEGPAVYDMLNGADRFQGFVHVSQATAVPAPATLALIGAGLVGLGLIRRARA